MKGLFRELAIAALIVFLVVSLVWLFGFFSSTAYQMGYDTGFDHQYRSAEGINYKFEKLTELNVFKELYQESYELGILAAKELKEKETLGTLFLEDPAYKEMKVFIGQDSTDKRLYYSGNYTCYHFSTDVVNHAKAEGIRVGYVVLVFPDPPSHAIICFDTEDRGLVFIEPQADREMTVKIGQSYWGQNVFTDDDESEIIRVLIRWSDGTSTTITET